MLLQGHAAQSPEVRSSASVQARRGPRAAGQQARLLSDHLEALICGIRQGRCQQAPRRLHGAVLTPDNLPMEWTPWRL